MKEKNFFKVDFKPRSFQSESQFSEVLRIAYWKEITWYVNSNTSYQHNNSCFLGKKGYVCSYSVHPDDKSCLAFKVPYNEPIFKL